MAESTTVEAQSPRGCADGEDADPPEEGMAETPRDDQEQFECPELLEWQVQVGAPGEEEASGPVAEAEAIAAGWMLDFLCLSLCRAFRDGRSEDFRRTRDSAEGECWAGRAGGCAEAGATTRRGAGTAAGGRGLVCCAVHLVGSVATGAAAAVDRRDRGSEENVGSNLALARFRLLSFSQILVFSLQ